VSRCLTALLTAAALGLTACGRDDDGEPVREASTTPTVTAPTTTPTAPEGCRAVQAPEPREQPELEAPKSALDRRRQWTVTLRTSCGTLRIRLDVKGSPKTASSFAALVRRGFYDGLTFHRIGRAPDGGDFVVQGGDPLGDGQGGPGYSVVEKPDAGRRYRRGVVAMAKTQLEEPGTSGSQFFIVTAKDAGLPPEYAVAGEVVGSEAALDRIADVEADPSTERPTAPVVIEDAELSSSRG